MWLYWLMFLVPALIAQTEKPQIPDFRKSILQWPISWWAVFSVFVIIIGWRHEVGGDWINYVDQFDSMNYYSISDALTHADPGFIFIEYISNILGFGIYTVNFVCGIIFSFGLIVFCRHMPRPWLGLAVSIPYIVIVLGMGYTRQGVALGCLMVGMSALGRGRSTEFFIWVLIGATFHKSAVILLPLAALAANKSRILTIAWVAVLSFLAYNTLLSDSIDKLRTNYIDAEYQSQGAIIRIAMNIIPALILIKYRNEIKAYITYPSIWIYMSIASIIFLVLIFIYPSNAGIDRVALYALPIQIIAFSCLPMLITKSKKSQSYTVTFVTLYYAMVLFVWLNFSVNSGSWMPYRNYIFLD